MLAKQLQGAAKSAVPQYIEDVFSTWLYTGNGSTQTITNGIDLSGKGGLVWIKNRVDGALWHCLYDTVRGATKQIYSNRTEAQDTEATSLTAFNTNGFSLGSYIATNTNGNAHASWTFRKQAKFFDVVTYTGNGSNQTINHNLGSVPGCIIIKKTSGADSWAVYHRAIDATSPQLYYIVLNSTAARVSGNPPFNNTAPTSTQFSVGSSGSTNDNGQTYVAYLFAHDAGGFGAAGTDNVISCGSFTTNGSGAATIDLGYEPQWCMVKCSTMASSDWQIRDNMRGWVVGGTDARIYANTSGAETLSDQGNPTATGFTVSGMELSQTYIYIAIRRGPMKTPTSGTSVFSPVAFSGTGTNSRQIDSGFPPDLLLDLQRNQVVSKYWYTRLFGNGSYLASNNTNAATGTSTAYGAQFDKIQNGYQQGTSDSTSANATGTNYVNHLFRRAPGFFDVVCYTGTGSVLTLNHNLGVVPEMMIVKSRSSATFGWFVYHSAIGNTKYSRLDTTAIPVTDSGIWNNTTPSSTTFTIGTSAAVNASSQTEVVYIFSTLSGVSKVGSYQGNGTSKTIDCGFTAGARFIMIKRTDSTGDWVTFDTARGIVSGNDPALYLNSTAAEVTGIDAIDPDNSGFIVNQETTFNLNVNNATYIFLAIA